MYSKMNKTCYVAISLLFFYSIISSSLQAQNKCDAIIGTYHVEDPFSKDESTVKIYKTAGGQYEAQCLDMKYPYDKDGNLRLDKKNPDPAKREIPCQEAIVFYGFNYDDAEDRWVDGFVYNPNSGKVYNGEIRFEDAKTIRLRGYIGAKLFGMTMTWTRID